MLASLGHKIKTALEIGATAKGLFVMGRGIYQGVSAYGPMVYNGARILLMVITFVKQAQGLVL